MTPLCIASINVSHSLMETGTFAVFSLRKNPVSMKRPDTKGYSRAGNRCGSVALKGVRGNSVGDDHESEDPDPRRPGRRCRAARSELCRRPESRRFDRDRRPAGRLLPAAGRLLPSAARLLPAPDRLPATDRLLPQALLR